MYITDKLNKCPRAFLVSISFPSLTIHAHSDHTHRKRCLWGPFKAFGATKWQYCEASCEENNTNKIKLPVVCVAGSKSGLDYGFCLWLLWTEWNGSGLVEVVMVWGWLGVPCSYFSTAEGYRWLFPRMVLAFQTCLSWLVRFLRSSSSHDSPPDCHHSACFDYYSSARVVSLFS